MTTTPRRSGRPSAITTLGMTGAPAAAAPITPPAQPDPTPVTSRRHDVATSPAPAGPARPTVAYTLRLTPDEALAADELTMAARRTTGRRIERSDLIRALLQLAADDPALLTRACDAATPRRH